MTFDDALQNLKLKFTSGNEIPVRQAVITRAEWDVIYPALVSLGGFLAGRIQPAQEKEADND